MRVSGGLLDMVNHNGVSARLRGTEHERSICNCDSPTRVTVHERDFFFFYCDSPTRVTVHKMREIQIGFPSVNLVNITESLILLIRNCSLSTNCQWISGISLIK